jgi:hypothetical protein
MDDYRGVMSKEMFDRMMRQGASRVEEEDLFPKDEFIRFIPNGFLLGWDHLTFQERSIILSMAHHCHWMFLDSQGKDDE